MRRTLLLHCLALCAALLAAPHEGEAHDSQPLLVAVDEQAPLLYRARLKMPPSLQGHRPPQLAFPAGCEAISGRQASSGVPAEASLFRCKEPLEGHSLRIDFADFNPSLAIFFRYRPLEGPVLTSLQPPDGTQWHVPAPSAASPSPWTEAAWDYLRLGVEHILLGFDHLLFVTCLLLIAGTAHRILLAVTGFTIAHSLTLALAALGVMRPPPVLVEALIALSIILLATEIVRRDTSSLTWRYPMIISMAFGLIHGFGFAAVLGEIGLPAEQELTALLSFNAGVEVGQVAFIALLLVLLKTLRIALSSRTDIGTSSAPSAFAAYLIGTVASFWLIQRVLLF